MKNHQQGLTLPELITVILVLGLMLAMGLPALQSSVAQGERRTSLNQVHHLLSLGRSEAIQRSTIVTICPLGNNNACTGDWRRPISVFPDPDNQRRVDNRDDVIHTVPSPDNGRLYANTGNSGYFQYVPSGRVRGTLGNITYCPRNDEPEMIGQVVINMGGRARRARDHDGDGIVDASDGTPVSCP